MNIFLGDNFYFIPTAAGDIETCRTQNLTTFLPTTRRHIYSVWVLSADSRDGRVFSRAHNQTPSPLNRVSYRSGMESPQNVEIELSQLFHEKACTANNYPWRL